MLSTFLITYIQAFASSFLEGNGIMVEKLSEDRKEDH